MNEQEAFWRGEFGDAYTGRNQQPVQKLTALFRKIIGEREISSVIELGANRGLNMQALRPLLPQAEMTAVEINETACRELDSISGLEVVRGSLLDFRPQRQWDLAFTKGVLIHIAPENLHAAYKTLVECARRYVLVIEYFSTQPQEIEYRKHAGKLWKRDFAGELMDRHGLKLIDYGFVYRRDSRYADDDTTWFLMERD